LEDGEDEDDIPLQQGLQAREMTKKKNAALAPNDDMGTW
jgi:hypothetical protein